MGFNSGFKGLKLIWNLRMVNSSSLTSNCGSTYLCEEIFNQMKITKWRYWSRLTDEHLNTAFSCGQVIINYLLVTIRKICSVMRQLRIRQVNEKRLLITVICINPQTATWGQIWPQPSFFFDNVFGVSYNDTNLRPLGRHSGFVLLVITVFLKFWFSLSGVRFDPRWPCALCFSVFSFVHFCGNNVL